MIRIASPKEQAFALQAANLLRSGQITKLQDKSNPDLRLQIPDFLKNSQPILAHVHGPFELQTINSFWITNGPTTKSFLFQAGSGNHWVIAQIVLEISDNKISLSGINLTPTTVNPLTLTRFDINARGALGYVWIIGMIANVLACLWAIFLIWRTRWLKRRWLWTLGSLFGFCAIALNWQNGSVGSSFLNISLFGARAIKGGPYAPWILTFSIPVFAILVIAKRFRYLQSVRDSEPVESLSQ